MSNSQRNQPIQGIIAYLRVSTEEQADSGLGLQAQRAAISAEATRRALPVIAWHEDAGVSGKSLNRAGLSAALEDLQSKRASLLVVSKLDRLSRSVHDATGLMKVAEKQQWGLVALDAQIDTSTPAGSAMVQVMLVFAELERRLIGQRTKDALAVKKARGVRLGRPRALPAGVLARIERDRAEALSWSEIARRLNEERVPTSQGGRWHPATVRLIATRDQDDARGPTQPATVTP